MSAVPSVGAQSPAAAQPSSAQSSSQLSQSQFLQLLVAQMQYQNPLNPVSSTQFLQETAMFNEVVDLQQLETASQTMLTTQGATEGIALIGKTVEATSSNGGSPVQGVVQALVMQNGQPMVQIGQQTVPVSQVTRVQG